MRHSYLYTKDKQLKIDASITEISEALKDKSNTVWLDLEKPDDTDIEMLLNIFNLHPLTIEDCIMPTASPKVEGFPEYIFLVLHAVGRQSSDEELKMLELDMVLGKNFLITVHTVPIPNIETTKEKLKKGSPIMTKGSDFLMYAISDALVDNYFPVIDKVDAEIDILEDKLFAQSSEDILQEIFRLKNEIMALRRSANPQRDVIIRLGRKDFSPPGKASTAVYFRDVYDHLVRMNDLLDTCKDSLAWALNIHISNISNKMNQIMKTLTIIATIFMPLTMITGIYGMNFEHMPELKMKYGYYAVWAVMVLVAAFMLAVFKRRRWF